MTILADAAADGVTVTLTPDAKVRLSGDPAAVARWADRIRADRAAVIRELADGPTEAEVIELRRLIWQLLWDVAEAEREAELAQCMDYVGEALVMYRRVRDEYERAEELPGQRYWPGRTSGEPAGRMTERWVGRDPLPAVFEWDVKQSEENGGAHG
jgi:hypothetical protein